MKPEQIEEIISDYLSNIGEGFPSVDDCVKKWSSQPLGASAVCAGVEAVRNLLLSSFAKQMKQMEEKEAEITRCHEFLDTDPSKIIRNAKDGCPEGREPRVLTLLERIKALARYGSDFSRWCEEKDTQLAAIGKLPKKWRSPVNRDGIVYALSLESALGSLPVAETAPAGKFSDEQLGRVEESTKEEEQAIYDANLPDLYARAMEEKEALRAENAKQVAELATAKHWNAEQAKEIARMAWRPVSVKPTREDVDGNNNVIGWNGFNLFFQNINGGFGSHCTHWRPFSPPPAPAKEESQREAFEAWAKDKKQFSLHRSEDTQGRDYFSSSTHNAWIGWQAALDSKEVSKP